MDPYVEGQRARDEGKPKSANPYGDTSNGVLWSAGWRSKDVIAKLDAQAEARRKNAS